MSAPEAPAVTDIERLIQEQQATQERLSELTDAVNKFGENQQWVIDNVKGIFEMFGQPGFMSMLPNLMGGMGNGGQPGPAEPA